MLIDMHGDVALLRLQGGKANAMDRALLERLIALVDEAQEGAHAIVITGYDKFFSGGLSLPFLAALDRPGMRAFIDLFHDAMMRVYTCPLPVVAAVNGHAIAGGCVLALECDARIMAAGDAKIGLNEVQLGIGLPSTVVEPLRAQVPPASLVPIALEGRLWSPADALAAGLVHEVVLPEALLERALARARELCRAPASGYAQVKAALHRPALDAIERHGAAEREAWLDSWFSPAGAAQRAATVARLMKS